MADEADEAKCSCRHCDGHIAFPLQMAGQEIECPHCKLETVLCIPGSAEISCSILSQETPAVDQHKQVKARKGGRTSLTPKQCTSAEGQELLNLLRDITHSGLITEEGVQRLNAWLDKNADSDIPAIGYLLQIPSRIEKLTTEKAFEVHFAIEHVLPKNIREEVKQRRQDAWLHSPLKPKATEAQLSYIRGLGGTPPLGINIAEASLLIEQLLGESN